MHSLAGGLPSPDKLSDLAARAKVLLERAVLTDAARPDRERRWLGNLRNSLPPVAMDLAEVQHEWGLDAAYAVQAEAREIWARKARRFRPTRDDFGRCDQVLAWLTWLRSLNDGRRDVKIIIAHAFGASYPKIAARFGRSDETVRRWHSVAVINIAGRFAAEIEAIG